MKEYKYKINGNVYNVAIGDIDDNVAQVEVNGVPYKVEFDQKKKAVKVAVTARLLLSMLLPATLFSKAHLSSPLNNTLRHSKLCHLVIFFPTTSFSSGS